MKLGLGSYTYTWAVGVPGHLPREPLTPLRLMTHALALGVRVIQFADNLPLTVLPAEERAGLARFATNNGLAIELGTRGIADVANLLAYLEMARQLGAPFVRLVVDSAGH